MSECFAFYLNVNLKNASWLHFITRGGSAVMCILYSARFSMGESRVKRLCCHTGYWGPCIEMPRKSLSHSPCSDSRSYFFPIKRCHLIQKFIACCNGNSTQIQNQLRNDTQSIHEGWHEALYRKTELTPLLGSQLFCATLVFSVAELIIGQYNCPLLLTHGLSSWMHLWHSSWIWLSILQRTQNLPFLVALDLRWLEFCLLLKFDLEKPCPLDQLPWLLKFCCGTHVCSFCCGWNAVTSCSWVAASWSSETAWIEVEAVFLSISIRCSVKKIL